MTTSTSNSGGWVNQSGYSHGKRHFRPDVTLTEEVGEPDRYGRVTLRQSIASPSVCKIDNQMIFSSSATIKNGERIYWSWGKVSIVENPNLMQRNLCSYCLKIYFRDYRPDLAEAYEALKRPLHG